MIKKISDYDFTNISNFINNSKSSYNTTEKSLICGEITNNLIKFFEAILDDNSCIKNVTFKHIDIEKYDYYIKDSISFNASLNKNYRISFILKEEQIKSNIYNVYLYYRIYVL